ncbi:hypothetical protein EV715DRAFT_267348 [Schizophyllum commune]
MKTFRIKDGLPPASAADIEQAQRSTQPIEAESSPSYDYASPSASRPQQEQSKNGHCTPSDETSTTNNGSTRPYSRFDPLTVSYPECTSLPSEVSPGCITVPGPRIPSDPEDQLFDNFAGSWARTTFANFDGDLGAREADDTSANEGHDTSEEDDTMRTTDEALYMPPPPVVDKEDDREWSPWNGKADCLMDILSAFPRSSMSNSQLETISWFCRAIGCETALPSVKQVHDHRDAILACAGAATEVVEGSLGNIYCVNDLGKILQHEWANPCVRPNIDDYPVEYSPNDVFDRQAQGQRWCREVHGNLSAPMYRGPGDQDFFVDEPALVDSHDGAPYVAMVTRWFKRDGVVWGRGHAMECDSSRKEYIIDGALCLEFKGSDLLLNYVSLTKLHPKHRLPSPDQIRGVKCGGALADNMMPWNEPLPNPWRIKANGKRVFTPPIEVYCDDTSGNQSKRWNKHNSFLFTLAGLDPKYAHLMYHIHFLATSNIAPPLEMLERIIDMLVDLRENGVEAYDYVHREVVLLAPWILNKLGDNPMQSELSSHIGTRGKCHCRICNLHRDCPAGRSEQQRIYDSLSLGSPRNRDDTREILKRQLDCFLRGAPTSAGSIATATGVKDQYFDHFSTKLGQACSEEKDKAHRLRQAGDEEDADKVTANLAALMRELRDDMPADLFNPGLRIPGLDPNADTPVEVLHTVLLGFVKYFWRDAISLLDDGKKKRLIARLDSLDVFELGLPPLRGQTLVQYAGSLTGHDFRVIAQVAPAVLFDLVDNNRYEAWLALCRLTPLALRPELKSLEAYLLSYRWLQPYDKLVGPGKSRRPAPLSEPLGVIAALCGAVAVMRAARHRAHHARL